MDPMTRALFGSHAVHVPANFIVQPAGDGIVLVVGVMAGATALQFGATHTHTLVMGDAVVRPHAVLETNHLRGVGTSGLITQGFNIDEWLEHGRIILDNRRQSTNG